MDILQIKLDACLRVYGKDFTTKSQERHFVYARAAFYTVAINQHMTLGRIGKICGDRDHATVLIALKNVGKVSGGIFVGEKTGPYMFVQEFKFILHTFETEMMGLSSIKNQIEIQSYTDDLLSKIEVLETENKKLRDKIFKKPKQIIIRESIRKRVTKTIMQLPDNILEDFEKYRLNPYLKLQESKVIN